MTLTYSEIMVRYGELSTKGKNRMRFINKLRNNIKDVLSIYPEVKVTFDRDRGHIYLNGTDYEPVAESLKQIFGIQAFSPVYKFEKDVEVLKKAVQDIMTGLYRDGLTFKVTAKRSDHDFVLDSRELNLTLGNAVFDVLPDIKAQMKGPDVNLKVEIRAEAAYISHEEIKGAGGLPVGTAGKGMLMLSGGIDSPVAGYLALKRGVDIEAVHFASPPYTSPGALKKAQDLTRKLTKFGGNIQFIEVPFTEIQEEIKEKAPEAYLMTLTRRALPMYQTTNIPYHPFHKNLIPIPEYIEATLSNISSYYSLSFTIYNSHLPTSSLLRSVFRTNNVHVPIHSQISWLCYRQKSIV